LKSSLVISALRGLMAVFVSAQAITHLNSAPERDRAQFRVADQAGFVDNAKSAVLPPSRNLAL
jgi:hypothetical protein